MAVESSYHIVFVAYRALLLDSVSPCFPMSLLFPCTPPLTVVDPRNPFAIFYEGYDPENYGLTWEEVGGSFVGSNFSAVALPCLDVFEAIDTMIIHNFTFQVLLGGALGGAGHVDAHIL